MRPARAGDRAMRGKSSIVIVPSATQLPPPSALRLTTLDESTAYSVCGCEGSLATDSTSPDFDNDQLSPSSALMNTPLKVESAIRVGFPGITAMLVICRSGGCDAVACHVAPPSVLAKMPAPMQATYKAAA